MDRMVVFSTGAKGGVGKSTMAVLAVEALREAGKSVSVLEGDAHSPTLAHKYAGSPIAVGGADLASLAGAAGVAAFSEAAESLPGDYLVVNAPATGVRIFEEIPEALAASSWQTRASWCLSLSADRNGDGVADDGLFESIDRGMLSAVEFEHITVVRSLFQLSYRGQGFWFDKERDFARGLGVREMSVDGIHPATLERIHRDPRPMADLISEISSGDPVVGATLQMFWHAAKTSLSGTVLAAEDLVLDGAVESPRGRLFGVRRKAPKSRKAEPTTERTGG